MFRTLLMSGAAAVAFTLPQTAAAITSVETVSQIEVTGDLTAIQDERAAAYWGTIKPDLEAAIAARLADKLGEDGAEIRVDVRAVELATAFQQATDLGNAALTGQVFVKFPDEPQRDRTFELRVTLGATRVVSADGTEITFTTIDTPEAYQALVDGFAESLASNIE
ncbi:MAG TPA: hypothetical protein PKD10_05100 [Paracoccaceae bacterium]|nr:hypothetical protein [Paracoccaceae bacterium]HMO72056.1 hypothetical protein [Paracoccaceae bacterium]